MAAEAVYLDLDDEQQLGETEIWAPEPDVEEDPIVIERKLKALKAVPKVKPSEFTRQAFWMPTQVGEGEEQRIELQRFSFEERRHMVRCYDTSARRLLFMCGRQVEKSTLLGNITLCYSCIVPGYRTLYVSPSGRQTETFSKDRIAEPIETSPMLKKFTTEMLSQNILEKQFVNRSKITLRYAFLNADRCVVGGTRVHFTDGGVATVKEVFENINAYRGRSVWAADAGSRGVTAATVVDAVAQGVRPVFDVRVAGGVELRCTNNQPLLTWQGWKQLNDLKPGDFVAVPRRAAHGAGIDRPVEEFRFIGYLLGDGSTKTLNACALHNGNEEVLRDFRRCAEKLGVLLWSEQDSNRGHWVHSRTKRQGFGGGRAGYKRRLKELGVIGADHRTKRVPHELFTGDEEQIAALLGGLYATDGWASVSRSGQYEIGYCSNSKQLLVDMRQLLLRFGVHAHISRQKKPSTEKAQGAYTLSIRHRDSVHAFAGAVAIPGKQDALAAVVAAAQRVTRRKNDYDRVPISYTEARAYLKNRYGLSTHSAWKQYGIQLRPGNVRDSVGRQVLYSWGAKLGDQWLMYLATSPLGWARVEEVISAGEEETYDLTVPGPENYLSDGLYIHNTRGIPAWLLEIDELQDILADNIPVMEQCLSHAPSHWRRRIYSGTPKSFDNTIEEYWSRNSTQNEWVVPCEGCNNWNILGEDNIGKRGLICSKCGKRINPTHPRAQWAAMVNLDPPRVSFEGYRIPQLMVPWRPWDDILIDYEKYSRARFYNEVLGRSFDSGLRPLTQHDIRRCCLDSLTMGDIESYRQLGFGQPIFAGIDWGCHDDQTRILTQDGFKYFRDLVDGEKVAQWDPDTRKMTFVTPKVRTVRNWSEPLYHFETRGGLDLMVTGTHRMRVALSGGVNWTTESAERLSKRGTTNVRFVGYVNWEGKELSEVTIPGLPASPGYSGSDDKTFAADDFIEFFGYMVTEGGVCFQKAKEGRRPSCLKMSQRATVNEEGYAKITSCMKRLGIDVSEFPNEETGDRNWSIYGKQYWSWFADNMGDECSKKRLPRWLLEVSARQLKILFDAMLLGDGSIDPRENCENGALYSTSKQLCEDFQEVCIRLGLRCSVSLHKKAEGNRKTRWRALWSRGRDFQFNQVSDRVKRVKYDGKVYCCSVPSGYIVTERNGKVAYQGNTGENSYTVLTLATYIDGRFRVFYQHRFIGREVEPNVQMDLIEQLLDFFNVSLIGCDYGGGYYPNDRLVRRYGRHRVWKFQYVGQQSVKVLWSSKLQRFTVRRNEVMADIFNAIKKGNQCQFPRWEEFEQPHAQDFLNIYSEYNDTKKFIQFKHAQSKPDDSFHSLIYTWLVSMLKFPRPDIIAPDQEDKHGNQVSQFVMPPM